MGDCRSRRFLLLSPRMTTRRSIILIRHGAREDWDNPDFVKTAPEPNDPDISPKGVLQARAVAARLAGETVHHLISSPFTRALHTAQHIANVTGLGVHIEWGVGEQIDSGWYFGDVYPDFPHPRERAKRFPSIVTDYEPMLIPKGMEPQGEPPIRERAAKISKLLLERFPGNLVIVAHYATVNVLVEAYTGSLVPHVIDVCSFTKLVQNGAGWRGEILADMSHIG